MHKQKQLSMFHDINGSPHNYFHMMRCCLDVLKLQYLGNSFIRKGEVHAKLKSIKQLAHPMLASIEILAWPLQSGPACKQLEEVASTATIEEPTNHTNWALKRYSWHSISQVVCLRISEDMAVRRHLSKILVLRCFECFTVSLFSLMSLLTSPCKVQPCSTLKDPPIHCGFSLKLFGPFKTNGLTCQKPSGGRVHKRRPAFDTCMRTSIRRVNLG